MSGMWICRISLAVILPVNYLTGVSILFSQMGINPKLASDFSCWFEDRLREISLCRKKCLVLDLDNTLWGGVLGEDGIDGIKIGGDYPGKAFLYFQEGLLELAKRGVILTICSKNNERDVLDLWEKNPFVLLRKEHFSAWRINWRNKADNIRELSEELNIGLDSLVFVDDNPTERELVRQMLPMVEVPEFPKQSYMLPDFLISLSDRYFRVYSVTEEDRRKTEQYKANASRTQGAKEICGFRSVSTESGDRDENRTDELIQCFPYCPDDSEDEPVQPDDPKVLGVGSHGIFLGGLVDLLSFRQGSFRG